MDFIYFSTKYQLFIGVDNCFPCVHKCIHVYKPMLIDNWERDTESYMYNL